MSNDLSQQVARILYHCDFPSTGPARLDTYLAMDAILRGREDVPRIYLSALTAPTVWGMISATTLTSTDAIQEQTIALMRACRAPIKALRVATASDRDSVLELLDAVLEEGWGPGRVIFEMARFTPFTNEDVYARTASERATSITCSKLKTILMKRHEEKLGILAAHSRLAHNILTNHNLSVYEKVLKGKLEAQWRERWLDANHYRIKEFDERLIHSLMFADAI